MKIETQVILMHSLKQHLQQQNILTLWFQIGYFGYSKPEHIPIALRDQSAVYCNQFKLMKQFEELYFRLVEKEQFTNGVVIREEKVFWSCSNYKLALSSYKYLPLKALHIGLQYCMGWVQTHTN